MRAAPEVLGTVTVPSGELVLLDGGLLRLWSGDAPPLLDDDADEPDVVRAANDAVDLELVGPDAATAAEALGLAVVKGRYAFDVLEPDWLRERVSAVAEEHGLRVEVRPVERVPHRRRVQLLLDEQPDGAEVPYHGGWAVAVRVAAADRPLRVLGARMDPSGPDAGRWHSVWVELSPGEPASSAEAGWVLVDEARLLFADATALSSWQVDVSSDGLVDLALWGRDATRVAAALGARPLPEGEGVHGWQDLAQDRARELAEELRRRRAEPDIAFAFDVRPHDDAFRLLAQARVSHTESGTVSVGGADMTGFFTTWGDGAFPVHLERDSAGRPCRLRVELGAPQTVARMRRFEELWTGPLSLLAFVSAEVAREGAPVGFLHRDAPDREQDSGWRAYSGTETQAYLDDADNVVLLPLRDLVAREPDLEPLLAHPPRVAFERAADGSFTPCEPPPEED